jgi:hypothetical protein
VRQIARAIHKFPAIYPFKARAANHVGEAVQRGNPPVRDISAILIVRIELHQHLAIGITSPHSSPIGAEVVEDGGFHVEPVCAHGSDAIESEKWIAEVVKEAEGEDVIELAEGLRLEVVDA